MTITIDSKLEARLRERAEAEGLTVPAYVKRLVEADQSAEDELESLALEGMSSGDPIAAGPGYWEEKHRRLDDRLKKTGTRERKPHTFALLATQPNMGWHARLRHADLKSLRVFRVTDFEQILVLYLQLLNGVDILRVVHSSRNLRALLRREGLV